MRRAVGILAVLLVTGAGCSGDGPGDDGIPVGEWAASVCGGLQGPVEDLAAALATIAELPDDIDPDAPLGGRIDDLQGAFEALPAYFDEYLVVVEHTAPPSVPDGATFRDQLLTELEGARAVVAGAALEVSAFGPATTATQFFRQAQGFAGFTEALDAVDVDFGEDVLPDVTDAVAADPDCREITGRLAAALG